MNSLQIGLDGPYAVTAVLVVMGLCLLSYLLGSHRAKVKGATTKRRYFESWRKELNGYRRTNENNDLAVWKRERAVAARERDANAREEANRLWEENLLRREAELAATEETQPVQLRSIEASLEPLADVTA